MYSFLTNLIGPQNYNDVAKFIDWLVDDDKFDIKFWNKRKSLEYTKRIKQLRGFVEKHYEHGGQKDINYPKRSLNHFAIYMQNDDSVCKDLIRHIRNGFAHGNIKLKTITNIQFMEICDYGKSNRTDKPSGQTAYILAPTEFIFNLYDEYIKVKKTKLS